jgi:hypothetical protein
MGKQVSTRIEYIYEEHYSSKAEDRFIYLVDFANKYCRILGLPSTVRSYVSREKINALVRSHFLDVIKFKEYHFEPEISTGAMNRIFSRDWIRAVHVDKLLAANKVAAFSAKWIMKHSPISFVVTEGADLSYEGRYYT